MSYHQLLSAELFNYSYDHYADHLEVGNTRFTEIMPKFCSTLGKAISEGWTHEKIAQKLEIDIAEVQEWIESYVEAEEIVSAIKNISPVFGGINLEDISTPLIRDLFFYYIIVIK